MRFFFLNLFIALTSYGGLLYARKLTLASKIKLNQNLSSQIDEVLYLPKKEALLYTSFQYRNVVADIIWFYAVNYFGKHWKTDKNYEWFESLCDAVTELDPGAIHVYQFAAMMLSWELGKPERAVAILDKGITHNPDSWFIRYFRGFVYFYFFKDKARALQDFKAAALLPNAAPVAARLAARILADDSESNTKDLENLIEGIGDPSTREYLQKKYIEKNLVDGNTRSK
jgi:hypothetical protein